MLIDVQLQLPAKQAQT